MKIPVEKLNEVKHELFKGVEDEPESEGFKLPPRYKITWELSEDNMVTISLALSRLAEISPVAYPLEKFRLYLIKEWQKQTKRPTLK